MDFGPTPRSGGQEAMLDPLWAMARMWMDDSTMGDWGTGTNDSIHPSTAVPITPKCVSRPVHCSELQTHIPCLLDTSAWLPGSQQKTITQIFWALSLRLSFSVCKMRWVDSDDLLVLKIILGVKVLYYIQISFGFVPPLESGYSEEHDVWSITNLVRC